MKEINLRMLTRLYNGQRYLPNILPKMDETAGKDSTVFYLNNYNLTEERKTQLPEYNLNYPVLVDDIELDLDFKNNYNNWLQTNVYSTDDSEVDEEEEDEEEEEEEPNVKNNDNNWHIGTPLPDALPVPVTAEELTKEINKLYLEELEREFAQKQEKKKQLEIVNDSWDQPAFSTGSWSSNDKKKKHITLDEDDEDADEVDPEVDPLQGINWGSLTEEELKKRLTLVEEKTVKRWMNVDMNDPSYMKVLNTFEGDVLEDDEGWPI